MMKTLCLAAMMTGLASSAQAAIKTQAIEYKEGNTTLKGYLAYDDQVQGQRPGVLVVPEWWGLNDYIRGRAVQLAQLGYVAFAVDMYGNGATADNAQEAAKLAGPLQQDRDLARRRVIAALQTLNSQPQTDPKRVAAIGYCFGGMVALELARSGADVRGVVTFHANLTTPQPQATRNVKAKILVCHGADDPHVPMQQVVDFIDEMKKAGADFQVNIYSGAQHGFTNPTADRRHLPGIAYNPQADQRSWAAMRLFFEEVMK